MDEIQKKKKIRIPKNEAGGARNMFLFFLVALQDFKEKLRNSQLMCSFIFYLVKIHVQDII